MKLFVCPKESYLPHHCDECHAECRVTVRTDNEQHFCIKCVRKMVELLESKEATTL